MLRRTILIRLLSSPSTSPVASLHRLLSAAAPAASPNPSFAVEDYLVGTCGLTRAQALKASAKLSHLKSPTNPDAVLSFLAGLGLSTGDVSAVVAKDPKLLCSAVDKTLAPVVTGLAGLGLSRDEIARLVLVARDRIRCRSIVSYLNYYLPIFGSFDNPPSSLEVQQ
jgi:mTERF domain-containing protein